MDHVVRALGGGLDGGVVPNVSLDQLEVRVIGQPRGGQSVPAENVEDANPVMVQKSPRQGGADKAGPTRDQHCGVTNHETGTIPRRTPMDYDSPRRFTERVSP